MGCLAACRGVEPHTRVWDRGGRGKVRFEADRRGWGGAETRLRARFHPHSDACFGLLGQTGHLCLAPSGSALGAETPWSLMRPRPRGGPAPGRGGRSRVARGASPGGSHFPIDQKGIGTRPGAF